MLKIVLLEMLLFIYLGYSGASPLAYVRDNYMASCN